MIMKVVTVIYILHNYAINDGLMSMCTYSMYMHNIPLNSVFLNVNFLA